MTDSLRRLLDWGRQWSRESALDVAGLMTLVLVLLHTVSIPQLREGILLVAAAGLVVRDLPRRAAYWFVLAALFAANHVLLWHVLDNHKWLLTYWCLALGVARLQPQMLATLAGSARLLIGLCFLFATVSKILSPDYLDGSFFEFTLLTDRRFSGFTEIVGGVPASVSAANASALRELARPYGDTYNVVVQSAPRIPSLATFLTWWTLAIEGSLALLFLLPVRVAGRVRDGFLVLFLLSTYPVATVVGFGRILAILGFVQTPNRIGIERAVYLTCFLLLPVYRFPFASVVRTILY